MNKKLYALALTLAVASTIVGKALADTETDGAASPILGNNAEVEESALGSFNHNDLSTDLDVDVDVKKTKIEDSFNQKTENEDSYNKVKTEGELSPAMSNSEIKDSDFEHTSQNALGEYALNLNKGGEVKDSNFGDTSTKGDQSPVLGEDAEIKNSDFISQETKGDDSPALNKSKMEDSFNTQKTEGDLSPNVSKGKIEDSNFVGDQKTNGALSPNMVDSKIDDSNLANQNAYGSGLNTNLQDSKVDDSNFAYQTSTGDVSPNLQRSNGNDIADQDAHGDFAINNQDTDFKDNLMINGDLKNEGLVNVNAAGAEDISIGNVATDNATIFDGDVSFGGGGQGGYELPGWSGGGGGDIEDVSVNTGVMTGSIMGEENQMANSAGIAVNGKLEGKDGGASLTNNQTSNIFVLGGETAP